MKIHSIFISLVIVLSPFIVGVALFSVRASGRIPVKAHLSGDAATQSESLTHEELELNWSFYPGWEYKPLLTHAEEYLVFVFHYMNHSDYPVYLMPTYTLTSPPNRRYAANEEIAMYIEDAVENQLKLKDETPVNFEVPAHGTRHYIVTFEKPRPLSKFDVYVDVFRDVTWCLRYEKQNGTWVNWTNTVVRKYKGRG